MSDIRVRSAVQRDAVACAQLFFEGTPANVRKVTIIGCRGYPRYIAGQIGASVRGGDHKYWVAEANGEVVGAAEFRSVRNMWFLNNIHVAEAARGLGVGTKLLQKGVAEGLRLGFGSVALDVFSDNMHARAWYQSLGFREAGHTCYYDVPWGKTQETVAGTIGGAPQATALQQAFEFSTLIVNGERSYSVGLLGDEWYRTTSREILQDVSAQTALRQYESGRTLLLVSDENAGCLPPPILVSVRMQADLTAVLYALSPF